MSAIPDPVELTQALVRLDTQNPPGNEESAARLLGELLAAAGLEVAYPALEPGRTGLVARLAGSGSGRPLVFTGHLDTVPLGHAQWSVDPLGGEIRGGRLYGRGSADMKGGVAAMAVAACRMAAEPAGPGDMVFAFTAGEETGCLGAVQMVASRAVPAGAGALVVPEPSGNRPYLGHKGALWLECLARGKGAHGSMPDQGDNAIYKAARAVAGLEDLFADAEPHPQLGPPTVNVGTMSGGTKINMVPDRATFQVDLRTVAGMDHAELLAMVKERMGPEIEAQAFIDLPGFLTPEDDPWVERVLAIMARVMGQSPQPGYVNYFTDAAILAPALGNPPTLILGPGEATQAHQTDEFCEVAKISQAAELYWEIANDWRAGGA